MGLEEAISWRSVVTCCKSCSSCFPMYPRASAGNMSKAKRYILLFPNKQLIVRMGLKEAISWRSVVHCCKSCSSCFPMYPRASAGNMSKAKRCILLFPNKQLLVRMGLEEAISWRSVVTCCKSCSSCFSMYPRASAGNMSKAKRCILLFPNKQLLVRMGLEEAISWRSVVTCCKSCSSCFSMYPRASTGNMSCTWIRR